jgi:hypothetical protein
MTNVIESPRNTNFESYMSAYGLKNNAAPNFLDRQS